MAEFFCELLSEEIPARMQKNARTFLEKNLEENLKKYFVPFTTIKIYTTPRRISFAINGIPLTLPDSIEEKKGPRIDAAQTAIDGFLKANNLSDLSQCEQRQTDKGNFWFIKIKKHGIKASIVLENLIKDLLLNFAWPKTMRFGEQSFVWVRPLKNILAIFDNKIITNFIELKSDRFMINNETVGHRFLSPSSIKVKNFEDYQDKLQKSFVVVDPETRKKIILEQATNYAQKLNLIFNPDPNLLDEVIGLVEYPVVLLGKINPEFMVLPQEILITSMRHHQKYFVLFTKEQKLAPYFLVVANLRTEDDGQTILAGNERVLKARLNDAQFFWVHDQNIKLASRIHALEKIVFFKSLGTMAQKLERIKSLTYKLAENIHYKNINKIDHVIPLLKADLTTQMVGEFPELQGIIGKYYALNEGLDTDIAEAIAEHYAPNGPSDRCPTNTLSVLCALADKIDTLVGFFAIGQKPTGSKDPFALRRTALSIIRLILENNIKIKLNDIFYYAYWGYENTLQNFDKNLPKGHQPKLLITNILEFIVDRFKVLLKEKNIKHDYLEAIFVDQYDDLMNLQSRLYAFIDFIKNDHGTILINTAKRVFNILNIEEKKDNCLYDTQYDEFLLIDEEEKNLHSYVIKTEKNILSNQKNENYKQVMENLLELQKPLDLFFDKIKVNAADSSLRINRLKFLSKIRTIFNIIGDFSKIEG
ncbi:MAG: glycine--tRNA ligase subunit beta [Alphaproteobacteria bacterium]|nr:glycine--tRNA ligase subunit beta [Alphaproteobacteria bacterium]